MADKKTTKATSKKAVEVKTIDQLKEDVAKLQNDYRESRRSHLLSELVNPHVLTVQRKSIARALTALQQAEATSATSTLKEEN
ncbi:MAG: 50S ribosomal protein L29 [Candidatus Microsaccharimonas sp.]